MEFVVQRSKVAITLQLTWTPLFALAMYIMVPIKRTIKDIQVQPDSLENHNIEVHECRAYMTFFYHSGEEKIPQSKLEVFIYKVPRISIVAYLPH